MKAPLIHFGAPTTVSASEAHGAGEENVEVSYETDLRSPLIAHNAHTCPHDGYLTAARVLAAVAVFASIGSILTAAAVLWTYNTQDSRGHPYTWSAAASLYILVLFESSLSCVAMSICLGLLLCRPYLVLITNPLSGRLLCLCFTIVVLLLCTLYTFIIPLVCQDWDRRIMPGTYTSIVPGVRMLSLVAFLFVLIANARRAPRS